MPRLAAFDVFGGTALVTLAFESASDAAFDVFGSGSMAPDCTTGANYIEFLIHLQIKVTHLRTYACNTYVRYLYYMLVCLWTCECACDATTFLHLSPTFNSIALNAPTQLDYDWGELVPHVRNKDVESKKVTLNGKTAGRYG